MHGDLETVLRNCEFLSQAFLNSTNFCWSTWGWDENTGFNLSTLCMVSWKYNSISQNFIPGLSFDQFLVDRSINWNKVPVFKTASYVFSYFSNRGVLTLIKSHVFINCSSFSKIDKFWRLLTCYGILSNGFWEIIFPIGGSCCWQNIRFMSCSSLSQTDKNSNDFWSCCFRLGVGWLDLTWGGLGLQLRNLTLIRRQISTCSPKNISCCFGVFGVAAFNLSWFDWNSPGAG